MFKIHLGIPEMEALWKTLEKKHSTVMSGEDDDGAEQYLLWKGKTHRYDELNAMNA